jgi:hypothetical protein
VGQQKALVPNGLFAVVKQRVHDVLVGKKLQITAPSYHKISTLNGVTSGHGSLGLELSLPCCTVVKSVVRMEWSQETIIQFIDEYKKKTNNVGSKVSKHQRN